jgi:hypothetical protein
MSLRKSEDDKDDDSEGTHWQSTNPSFKASQNSRLSLSSPPALDPFDPAAPGTPS